MRHDEDLGIVHLCPGCKEEWPFDDEFWHMRDGTFHEAWMHRCRACCAEYTAQRRMLAQRVERADRTAVAERWPGRCLRPMQGGAYCGRNPGHGNGCRSSVAMLAERERKREGRAA